MSYFLKKILTYSIFISLTLFFIGYILEYQFSKDLSDKITWQNNKHNQHFDYAFLGTSRSLNLIDINTIDRNKLTKGINLGIGGADFRTLYMTLYSFLEINENKLEQIFIQVDPFMLYRNSVYSKPDYDHYFFSYSDHNAISSSINKSYLWVYKYFPVIKYIEYNSVYNLTHLFSSFLNSDRWEQSMGSSLLESSTQFVDSMNDSDDVYSQIINEEIEYLEKILQLLSEYGIQTTLFTAPVYNFENRLPQLYPNFEGNLDTLIIKYQINYFNFMNELPSSEEYFRDSTHLNRTGALMFTETVMESMVRF